MQTADPHTLLCHMFSSALDISAMCFYYHMAHASKVAACDSRSPHLQTVGSVLHPRCAARQKSRDKQHPHQCCCLTFSPPQTSTCPCPIAIHPQRLGLSSCRSFSWVVSFFLAPGKIGSPYLKLTSKLCCKARSSGRGDSQKMTSRGLSKGRQ